MKQLAQNIDDLLELFFPSLCITCENRLAGGERFLCFDCWQDLPVTNFHLNVENKVAQLFWGRVQIHSATSYFSYKKGSRYQKLIHFIKYKGMKELGFEIGQRFGFILKESENFCNVDSVVPVPLHPKKYKSRGYNQSEWIARGISKSMGIPVSTQNLYRKIFTSTQTRKNRFERWQNVEGIFGIKNPQEFEKKQILLIDDVVTTGSTLEACAFQLLKIKGVKVAIATLAFADI
ncbi:ComF family protein [Maribellus comscasis]|uniref:ComF family protein n=1 Tax=Maribellus comscasis TaxID=2681766 RepID=A0A6I6K1G6_9BACT|nr:phosphoribosyltransferase family protein [Maribellus comscasis]QGY43774.1 ComF family protein [Maribellus comscasis]